jgi:hypothetical protein
MSDDLLYKKAVKQMRQLAEDVLADVEMFADDNNYDKEWVLERFQEEFSKAKKRWLNGKFN